MENMNEINDIVVEEVVENMEVPTTTGGHKVGLVELVTGGILMAAAAIGGVAYKNREKIKKNKRKKQITKWKKEGYIVCKEETDGKGMIRCIPITDEDFE